ncbi:MAG: response regulator transcription factor [Bacilli bacterium]|nr:response regulator transcription factor [Bacilli bacterium]
MLKIALLDDDKTALLISKGAIESFFQEKNIAISLDAFSSPINFLAMAEEKNYRLVFLDIDMPEINGLEVGKKLKGFNPQTDIIYLSQREDLVFDTLQLHPFGFIRKSRIIQDFASVLELFVNTALNTNRENKKITISCKTETISADIDQVMYIEGNRNYQTFYLKDGSKFDARVLMGELESKLKENGFIRVHKGYLVNYLFIRMIGTNEVKLTNNKVLPLSSKRKDEIMEEYLSVTRKNKSIYL